MKYFVILAGLVLALYPVFSAAEDRRQFLAEVSADRVKSASNDGSLWSEERQYGFLFGDLKAHNVGDVVTVRIVESSRGNKNASTKTEKDSSLSTSISAFFGMSPDKLSQGGVGAETSEKHDGSGSTSRSSDLSAVLTAKVIDRLPNGNLVIDGRREVIVNNETQLISLSGIVRPEDIGPSNMVLSTYISDAKIVYTGDGVIGDKQKVGWFVRIMDAVWPF